jgi:hypothetical protein
MSRKKRPLPFLALSLISFISLALLVYFFPPNQQLSIPNLPAGKAGFQFSILYFFLLLFYLLLFSSITYTFKSKTHGVLISSFVILYLLFRLNGLTHPFFLLLLFALFITLELLFSYRR